MDNNVDYNWYFHVWKNYGNFEGVQAGRVLEFCSFQFLSDLDIGIGFGGYIVCDICNSCYCA